MNLVDDEVNKKFPSGCFLPLNAIAIHPQGYPHFCLTSTLESKGSIKDLNENRKNIHLQLLSGDWPDSCKRCLNKEKRNLQSRRTRTWERKIKIYGRELAELYVNNQIEPNIRHLEISFSNVCNISCAMCSSEFSSTWINHDSKAIEQGLQFREFTKPFQKIARASPNLLEEVLTQSDNLDLIIVKGGEPTREPLALDFLEKISERSKNKKSPYVFIQSNGTRPPKEWIYRLKNLKLEIGFSFDGWGNVFNWIRGANFDQVLSHFHEISELDFVRSMSIDFTLSAYNCFHLPIFLEKITELKSKIPKLDRCPVFQWVQQPYASPLNLKQENREKILELSDNILNKNEKFFLNSDNLRKILLQPRAKVESIQQGIQWYEYMNKIRGFKMEEYDELIRESLFN